MREIPNNRIDNSTVQGDFTGDNQISGEDLQQVAQFIIDASEADANAKSAVERKLAEVANRFKRGKAVNVKDLERNGVALADFNRDGKIDELDKVWVRKLAELSGSKDHVSMADFIALKNSDASISRRSAGYDPTLASGEKSALKKSVYDKIIKTARTGKNQFKGVKVEDSTRLDGSSRKDSVFSKIDKLDSMKADMPATGIGMYGTGFKGKQVLYRDKSYVKDAEDRTDYSTVIHGDYRDDGSAEKVTVRDKGVQYEFDSKNNKLIVNGTTIDLAKISYQDMDSFNKALEEAFADIPRKDRPKFTRGYQDNSAALRRARRKKKKGKLAGNIVKGAGVVVGALITIASLGTATAAGLAVGGAIMAAGNNMHYKSTGNKLVTQEYLTMTIEDPKTGKLIHIHFMNNSNMLQKSISITVKALGDADADQVDGFLIDKNKDKAATIPTGRPNILEGEALEAKMTQERKDLLNRFRSTFAQLDTATFNQDLVAEYEIILDQLNNMKGADALEVKTLLLQEMMQLQNRAAKEVEKAEKELGSSQDRLKAGRTSPAEVAGKQKALRGIKAAAKGVERFGRKLNRSNKDLARASERLMKVDDSLKLVSESIGNLQNQRDILESQALLEGDSEATTAYMRYIDSAIGTLEKQSEYLEGAVKATILNNPKVFDDESVAKTFDNAIGSLTNTVKDIAEAGEFGGDIGSINSLYDVAEKNILSLSAVVYGGDPAKASNFINSSSVMNLIGEAESLANTVILEDSSKAVNAFMQDNLSRARAIKRSLVEGFKSLDGKDQELQGLEELLDLRMEYMLDIDEALATGNRNRAVNLLGGLEQTDSSIDSLLSELGIVVPAITKSLGVRGRPQEGSEGGGPNPSQSVTPRKRSSSIAEKTRERQERLNQLLQEALGSFRGADEVDETEESSEGDDSEGTDEAAAST